MARFLIVSLFLGMSTPLWAHGNPYDLLGTMDKQQTEEVQGRMPASVDLDQISVRKKLPEAKRLKTSFSLQREMLSNGAHKSPIEEESEEH